MDIKKDFPEQVSSLQNRKKINEGISEVEKEHNKIFILTSIGIFIIQMAADSPS